MKIRFPLYAKMLVWFFLNLVFLAIIFYAFFKIQFRVGLDSLLLGRAGDRIQSVSDIISTELREAPKEEWDGILKRFSDGYRIQFYLFQNDGSQVAGQAIALPPEVGGRIRHPAPPPPDASLPPPPHYRGTGPNRPPSAPMAPGVLGYGQDYARMDPPQPGFLEADAPPRFGGRRHQGLPGNEPRFLLPTSNPRRYWAGVRIGAINRAEDAHPMILLAMSESLSGGGLFIDYLPWATLGAGSILISILFWLPLARGLTRSISQLTHATEEIAAGRFNTRVDARRRDELGRLGQAVNQMASRLSGFVTGQKRFLGDIAHELCSPIARIQLALGILEQRADEKQAAQLDDLREEVQHMSNLVNELLSFSKASLQPASVKLQPVAVRAVAEQAIRRESDETDNVLLDVASDIRAEADSDLLLRAIANILRNSIRYSGGAGPITIGARASGNEILLTISDCGPGVPAECLSQIFDPFYRPETSRDRQTGGVGLGLAIVKTCIESCQGEISCRNVQPSGFEVSIKLRNAE